MSKEAKEAIKKEEVEEVTEQAMAETEDVEEETVPEDKLPFPRATIVNMLRKHLTSGKQIKGQVKTEMNLWLGKVVERLAKKMDAYPYTYVDGSMFREAIEPYENMQEIEKEKERLIKELEAVKAACDVLIHEVDRKFVLRSGFAYDYMKEKEKMEKK
jgi:hypothetical protein